MAATIEVTHSELAILEWALDPMADADPEETGYTQRDFPILGVSDVTFKSSVAFLEDLLYRVEEQYPDMAKRANIDGELSRGKYMAEMKAVKSLTAKLRKVLTALQREG